MGSAARRSELEDLLVRLQGRLVDILDGSKVKVEIYKVRGK